MARGLQKVHSQQKYAEKVVAQKKAEGRGKGKGGLITKLYDKETVRIIMAEKRKISDAKKNGTYVEPVVEKTFDASYLKAFEVVEEEEEQKQPEVQEQIKPKGKGKNKK